MNIKKIAVMSLSLLIPFLSLNISHADELDKIKSNGVMKIAASGVFPPFSFVDTNNNVVGFDIDIANEIAKRLDVKSEIVTTPFDGIIAGLVTGRYNAVIGSMAITEERKKAVDFVGPYYRSGIGIFVKEGSAYKTLSSLEGKNVGAILGETSEKWAREQNKFNLRTYKGLPEMLIDLNSGRVDAIISDDIVVYVAIKNNDAKIVQIEDDNLPKFDIGMAIRKKNPDLAAAMKKALDDMMADGTYEAISKKWVGTDIR
ncbi:transporter substrate-binding domain-containing protein [Bartonella sp. HY038]|uniref:transporter substrate-binding domain-containing protein n=1 Tax=Bartonella sp. HY038 TaxID=2759660 RepID=UPI001FEDEFAC|nr:transporter substrate-binding domain-containing protein [Bartonella sp. HY038]